MILLIFSAIVVGLLLYFGGYIVPEQESWIIQRLGRFSRKLEPGLNWIIPFMDVIAYRHSLKEEAIFVPEQTAITQDNVTVVLDGVVYIKIVDPIAASYGVKEPIPSVIQLVQTTKHSIWQQILGGFSVFVMKRKISRCRKRFVDLWNCR